MVLNNNTLGLQLDANPGEWEIETKLFNIFTAYLPKCSNVTAQSAAQDINGLFPLHRNAKGDKEEPSSFLSELWDLMFRVIQQVDYKSEPAHRLIKLITALKKLPSTTTFDRGHGAEKLWQDLPGIEYQIGEVWNRFDTREMTPDSEEFNKWKNLNGVLALMSNEGLVAGTYLALTCLTLGLEQENVVTSKTKKGVKTQLEIHLPIAALWVATSASYLYKLSVTEACLDEAGRESTTWKGAKGYSLERWAFWKERFAALKSHQFIMLEGKTSAEIAISQMNSQAI